MFSWLDGQLFSHIKATMGDKIYWRLFALKGLSDVLLASRVENTAFPPPSPLCNVVPLFELPTDNNKHSNFERRGEQRGVDSFVLLSYPI